ncbi:hypothetical protein BH18ACT9_BH18ACT9_00570 [soil metagenome]
MKQQDKRLWRGSIVPLLVTGVSLAMVTTVAGPAQAAPVGGAATAVAAAAAPKNTTVLSSEFGKAKSRVEGRFGNAGTVTGKFTPRRFKVGDSGNLKAVGTLRATLTRGDGTVVGTTTRDVSLLVRKAEGDALRMAAAPGDCQILNLVLGPLDLNLLGLKVHLDKVVLNIVATPGPGNLLGNLLCAVAGLLDGAGAGGLSGLLASITQILNSILAILRL